MNKNKLKTALGGIVGLGVAYLAGWALNESAVVHRMIGAGLLLWLTGALAFLVAAAVVFAISFWRWRQ